MISPTTNSQPTCPVPMSGWRLTGYVSDSEEEDDDLESLSILSTPPSLTQPKVLLSQRIASSRTATPSTPTLPEHLPDVTASTNVIEKAYTSDRSGTESPDPLQSTPQPTIRSSRKAHVSSQILGLPTVPRVFDLELIVDSSDSSTLSECPSDVERNAGNESSENNVLARVDGSQSNGFDVEEDVGARVDERTTENVVQDVEMDIRRGPRSLRTRKPIQIHPYRLEGELYRREWQGVGLKPVPRPRSPESRHRIDEETQEQEYQAPYAEDTPMPSSPPNHTMNEKTPRSHTSTGRKRRKLLHLSHKRTAHHSDDRSPTLTGPREETVWDIPHSPQFPSTPSFTLADQASRATIVPSAHRSALDISTTSNTSSAQQNVIFDVHSLVDSESDTQSSVVLTEQPRRLLARRQIPAAESSSEEAEDESEPAEEDFALRKIGRRIKGVLPASWLRLDQQAQERRKLSTQLDGRSPRKPEPQRGVAQPITKSSTRETNYTRLEHPPQETITLSDDSSSGESNTSRRNFDHAQRAAFEASQFAAVLDSRYADDDSTDMENDRLPLFTLGGRSRNQTGKRQKRQSKLTDSFAKPRRNGIPERRPADANMSGSSKHNRPLPRTGQKKKKTPPALSIVDLNHSTSHDGSHVPQFVKIAMRQARQRPDQARQKPLGKYVRLHTGVDTEEANVNLQHWKQGKLDRRAQGDRPRPGPQSRSLSISKAMERTSPLSKMRSRSTIAKGGLAIRDAGAGAAPLREGSRAPESNTTRKITEVPAYHTAQLEGPEADFVRPLNGFSFTRGLKKTAHQFPRHHWQPFDAPQLASFLADTDENNVALDQSKSLEEHVHHGEESPTKKTFVPRRIPRKIKTRRIDVQSREYRQPIEPSVEQVISNCPIHEAVPDSKYILQGLGPYDTRYSTNFDLPTIVVGTYFAPTTFIGSGELHAALCIDKRQMCEFSGRYRLKHKDISFQCGPWQSEVHSQ